MQSTDSVTTSRARRMEAATLKAFDAYDDCGLIENCWVHYLFLTRPLGMAPPGFLLIDREHPVEGAVIFGAPQRQHLIGVLYIPPGP
jgi:hypothetical protein